MRWKRGDGYEGFGFVVVGEVCDEEGGCDVHGAELRVLTAEGEKRRGRKYPARRRSGRPICDLSCKAYSKISEVKKIEVICEEKWERI